MELDDWPEVETGDDETSSEAEDPSQAGVALWSHFSFSTKVPLFAWIVRVTEAEWAQ
jgi:hypothetical protein